MSYRDPRSRRTANGRPRGRPPRARAARVVACVAFKRLLLDDVLAAACHRHDRSLLRVVAGRLAVLGHRLAELEGPGRTGVGDAGQCAAQGLSIGVEVAAELDLAQRGGDDVDRVVGLRAELVGCGLVLLRVRYD